MVLQYGLPFHVLTVIQCCCQTSLAELQRMFKVLQENKTSSTKCIAGRKDMPLQNGHRIGAWMQMMFCHNKDEFQMEPGLT